MRCNFICPLIQSPKNTRSTAPSLGRAAWVFTRRRNSSCIRSMAFAAPFGHPLVARCPQRRFHFFFQNHLNHFPHPLPNGRLQTFSHRNLLVHFLANASLPHGVFLLCPKPPAKRFRAFLFKPSQENTPPHFLQESARNQTEFLNTPYATNHWNS